MLADTFVIDNDVTLKTITILSFFKKALNNAFFTGAWIQEKPSPPHS